MRPVLRPADSYAADQHASNELGIRSLLLMENAARSAAEILFERSILQPQCNVLILCGTGNNGGDGFALARHLHESVQVTIVLCGTPERMTPDTKENYVICQKLGIPILQWEGEQCSHLLPAKQDVIIDALLGVGARSNPREPIASLIVWANAQAAYRVALDIPSGLDPNEGWMLSPCFHADLTITMGAYKTGLLLNAGPAECGEIEIAEIGIPHRVFDALASTWVIDSDDIRRTWRKRQLRTTKFDYGRVVIVAGSAAMPGAAALCANAAIAAGAGLVELVTPELHPALFPEVMPYRYSGPYLTRDALPLVMQRLERATVAVIGPGLGSAEETTHTLREIVQQWGGKIPLVLDADGLRSIKNDDMLQNVTITPHRGEFARMLGSSIQGSILHERAVHFAQQTSATVVLKDFPIQISNGRETYWYIKYNPALASGGTGDVLSGIIASLWAQGYSQFDAAWMGVVVHSLAGRYASEEYGESATRASHLIEALGPVTRALSENKI
ncbi:MAG: NAD(P)H-hydrate dehydratase [Bacteroidota bacterium]|nr:NAD(P)H-hydrate dehydratase [Candidatus Kapabacteria bacterium]MDW8074544.1 NAD(P)H-hydrate dehydratase [Bacteroidota bacterium]MDW8270980.1 NAD(P)H-hydrate dehydratase [Bacteroidota bacterium]